MHTMMATAYVGSMKIFGWIAILLGYVMDFLYNMLGKIGINNIGVAIILLTLVIYTCMLPLTYKQQKFSRLSMKMQPELKALQAKYKDRRDQASQQAMMEEQREIYDKYGVSPTGSCVQAFLSILFLFPLYRVIYNIPAYVTHVKELLMPAVDGIMATSGYQSTFDTIVSDFGISLRNIGVSSPTISDLTASEIPNRIVDILYKLSPDNWSALAAGFPNVDITSVETSFNEITSFCFLNITNSPQYLITHSWQDKSYLVLFLAILVPVLAGVTQFLNFKLTPQSNSSSGEDMMAQQMKTMNVMMPLMSVFFCFTLPVGLGLYWITGAVIRSVYQVILNRHFDKIDLNEIIEANREKAAKKKEKRGINLERMNQAAQMNTRTLKSSNVSEADRSRQLQEADEVKSKAVKGSLAQRANMVKEFNERNSKQ